MKRGLYGADKKWQDDMIYPETYGLSQLISEERADRKKPEIDEETYIEQL